MSIKQYGNEKTSLKLTEKALAVYSVTDPLRILEQTTTDEDGSEIRTYTMTGAIEAEGLTADEVNEMLEELADETKGEVPPEYYQYYKEPEEIIEQGLYDAAVALMDDEISEAVNADLAPCTEQEFLAEYMARHEQKHGVPFVVN